MPITQVMNSKANVKKSTNQDIPFASAQPVLSRYTAVSTASQTVINLPFSVDTINLANQFFLSIDGKVLTVGIANDYTFTAIGSDGTSSQVTLTVAIPVNLNIQAWILGVKAEREFQTDNRFVQLYEAQDQGFQPFINQSNVLSATTVTGTPTAGTFYSTIQNRAAITDPSQDLRPRMGIDRLPVQSLALLQNEFGPNGEQVFASGNDSSGILRFVGNWSVTANVGGIQVQASSNLTDYVEVTFYGTGLNVLTYLNTTAFDTRASVDGGAEGSNILPSGSTVINNRNYSTNTVIPVVSGLALGVHTVKMRANSVNGWNFFGVEILTQTSTLTIPPGVAYAQGKKYTSATLQTLAYTNGVTGTRGGRSVVYQKADGTIGTSWQAVNSAQLNLTSADHTNEEVARTYFLREFGVGRADDFSLSSGAGPFAFTLDDGTTTLLTSNADISSNGLGDGIIPAASGAFWTITFVGTGLDIDNIRGATTTCTYSVTVDGVVTGSGLTSAFSGTGNRNIIKIVSGLPYGTHTVKLTCTNLSGPGIRVGRFIAYQPKKPSIPSGAIELADYNVMANYVANTVQGSENIATGVLRKAAAREMVYTGSSFTDQIVVGSGTAGAVAGYRVLPSTSGNSVKYTFFGTGFDIRMSTPNTATTYTVSVDGSSNLSAYTIGYYGQFTSFVASTGVVTSNGTGNFANGIWVSGLALGFHTVTFTQNASVQYGFESIDIITPIHSAKSNLYSDLQNTLSVGSQGISDNRKLTPVKDLGMTTKAIAQALGITYGPTTTSTSPVPMPDMSVTIMVTTGTALEISYSAIMSMPVAGVNPVTTVYVDGVPVGRAKTIHSPASGGYYMEFSDSFIALVGKGVHKVDLYWATSGANTTTTIGDLRVLTVREK